MKPLDVVAAPGSLWTHLKGRHEASHDRKPTAWACCLLMRSRSATSDTDAIPAELNSRRVPSLIDIALLNFKAVPPALLPRLFAAGSRDRRLHRPHRSRHDLLTVDPTDGEL